MINTLTLADAEQTFGVHVDDHHDRGADIPVLTGLQAQGDVLVLPAQRRAATTPVPRAGIPVVRGENGGHTHLLLASGTVTWDPSASAGTDPSNLDLGVLTVADGATAYLAHPEHAYSGIGAGTYVLRRQREQADVARFVAD